MSLLGVSQEIRGLVKVLDTTPVVSAVGSIYMEALYQHPSIL